MMLGGVTVYVVAVAVALPLAFLFSVVSALFERGGHIRIRHWAKQAGPRIGALYASRSRFEAFRYVVTFCSRGLLILLALLTGAAWPQAGWLLPVVGLALYLLWAEWMTRYLVRRHAERTLEVMTPIYKGLYFFLSPLVFLLRPALGFAEVGTDEDDEDEASEDEIDAYIDVGRREGILEPEEEEMVRSVVDFGDTQVRSVMTPRVEINSVPANAGYAELAEKFFETKNSRLPLYRDSIDDIVGILHIRDLFAAMSSGAGEDAIGLCQQPLYIPESKALRDCLEELQARHQQMAIIVDEYGGVAGLVTVEDLVEEIVGEIRDEHEDDHAHETLSDGRWRLSGRTHLEDFREIVDVEIEVDTLPYETLSGLICGHLGYVPKVGERVRQYGLELLVEEADERRVTQVGVSRRVETGVYAVPADH